MAVLFSIDLPWGCMGSCGKNCYDAKKPDCHCICGGVNHGVGLAQANENTKILTDEQIMANFLERCQSINASALQRLIVFKKSVFFPFINRRQNDETLEQQEYKVNKAKITVAQNRAIAGIAEIKEDKTGEEK